MTIYYYAAVNNNFEKANFFQNCIKSCRAIQKKQ